MVPVIGRGIPSVQPAYVNRRARIFHSADAADPAGGRSCGGARQRRHLCVARDLRFSVSERRTLYLSPHSSCKGHPGRLALGKSP
jgi:hypothetical protein